MNKERKPYRLGVSGYVIIACMAAVAIGALALAYEELSHKHKTILAHGPDLGAVRTVHTWSAPAGFILSQTSDGTAYAYRYLKRTKYDCDTGGVYCWGLEFVSSRDCEHELNAELSITDNSGANIDWTNATAAHLMANQRAKLTFGTYKKSATGAEISRVDCE